MDFTIIQIILVMIVTFIAAIDQFSFLESLYQPIVLCTVVGAILGAPGTGMIVGGTYQLISIGSMPVGGAQPPNVIIGGIMATVFAVSSNMAPNTAVGLAVPFALLGQYAVTLTFTLMSPIMAVADKHAKNANPKGIAQINYLSMAILGSLFAVIILVGMLSGQLIGDQLAKASYNLSWLMAGLDVAGGMMKYVGFGILMKIMLSGELWGFYFLGFAFATIVNMVPGLGGAALLILSMIGGAIAIYDFQMNTKMSGLTGGNFGGGDEDGI
ncbi:PTS sugar transporter subunit IIC [Erysipelothrix sp. HDW6C]|uniref:PTS mannose/fructose/sorbose/N-acetylgalactosamine transporter subunit IIC n=1 Tax=Erysipelothrix sp. HDW6C TaxID=2714930 RepID=UPI00140E8688|nr:PTS sugar transporter subunit IIC [Erysipelothrix sp. HDW6C]QIK69247.1 PTS sugar transporter subunit IIC [Erysipelothrix sp. HDW6C]